MNFCLWIVLRNSLTHWTAWPAIGRCVLQTSRSPAMSQAASTVSPTSISSWRIQVCRGRPRGRFHAGLSSGRWPARELTTRRSTSCAVTDSCRRRKLTWPNTEIRLSGILLWMLCCWVWFITDTFGTKSNQRIPRIRRKQYIWNDSSFCSSDDQRFYKVVQGLTKPWSVSTISSSTDNIILKTLHFLTFFVTHVNAKVIIESVTYKFDKNRGWENTKWR